MSYYELTSIYGHDTFLLDVNNVGTAVKVCMVVMTTTQTHQAMIIYTHVHDYKS